MKHAQTKKNIRKVKRIGMGLKGLRLFKKQNTLIMEKDTDFLKKKPVIKTAHITNKTMQLNSEKLRET